MRPSCCKSTIAIYHQYSLPSVSALSAVLSYTTQACLPGTGHSLRQTTVLANKYRRSSFSTLTTTVCTRNPRSSSLRSLKPLCLRHKHSMADSNTTPVAGMDSFQLNNATTYSFPTQKLKRRMDDPSKTPLVLVACGSFSPITYLHLRMFEMAADYCRFSTDFELIGGYLSPVSDAYKKAGLASAGHR